MSIRLEKKLLDPKGEPQGEPQDEVQEVVEQPHVEEQIGG